MPKSFGERLKKVRIDRGLRQEDIGAIVHVGKSTVSQWENNIHVPDIETIVKIANYLNVTTDYLLGRTNKKEMDKSSSLTSKDQREIEKILEQTRKSLEESDGLMLSGDPVSPEAIESILEALEFGMRQAKKINKKYTPKKYRKDDKDGE